MAALAQLCALCPSSLTLPAQPPSAVYRVWRKDGVFTCPLCKHASPFPAYLRDHLNPDRPSTNRCDIDAKLPFLVFDLPDNWELMPSGTKGRNAPSSSSSSTTPKTRPASGSAEDDRSAKRYRSTPTRAQVRPPVLSSGRDFRVVRTTLTLPLRSAATTGDGDGLLVFSGRSALVIAGTTDVAGV